MSIFDILKLSETLPKQQGTRVDVTDMLKTGPWAHCKWKPAHVEMVYWITADFAKKLNPPSLDHWRLECGSKGACGLNCHCSVPLQNVKPKLYQPALMEMQ